MTTRKIFVKYDETGAAVDGSLDAPADASFVLFAEADTETEAVGNWAELFALDFSTVLAQSPPFAFPLKFAQSLDHAKAFLRREVWAEYERALYYVFDYYPPSEREGWPLKYLQAVNWLQTPPGDKPALIAALASPACMHRILLREAVPDRDLTADDVGAVDDLAGQIFANAALFQEIYGRMTGYKTAQIRLIDALTTVSEVNAFSFDFPQFLPVGG